MDGGDSEGRLNRRILRWMPRTPLPQLNDVGGAFTHGLTSRPAPRATIERCRRSWGGRAANAGGIAPLLLRQRPNDRRIEQPETLRRHQVVCARAVLVLDKELHP